MLTADNYDGEWKSRINRELEEINKGENIVIWIKGQRISWLGHLEIMEEDRMPKKIFTQELEGTRRRERPRKGWKEVERYLQVLGMRRWWELVTDRKKWKDIVRQAKAHYGLYRKWKKLIITQYLIDRKWDQYYFKKKQVSIRNVCSTCHIWRRQAWMDLQKANTRWLHESRCLSCERQDIQLMAFMK